MATGLRLPLCVVLALWGALGGCLGQTHTPLTASGGNTKIAVREVLRSTVTADSAVLETTDGLLRVTAWPGDTFRLQLARNASVRALGSFAVESFAYQQSAFRRVSYECERADAALVVRARSTGAHPVWWNETRLVIRDVPRAPVKVRDGSGAALAHAFDGGKKTLNVTLPSAAADFEIRASW